MSVRISLDTLTPSQLTIIRKLLFLQPKTKFVHRQNPYFAPPTKEPILFYMENKKRNEIYLPYAFATKLLQTNPNLSLSHFPESKYNFTSTLRPEQIEICQKALETMLTHGSVILGCYPGFGKCLGENTSILLYDGTTKPVQDIIVGDILRGDDLKPRNVLSINSGYDQLYKITTSDNTTFTANSDHILTLFNGTHLIDISIKDFLSLDFSTQKTFKCAYIPVDYPYNPSMTKSAAFKLGKMFGKGRIPNEIMINSFEIRKEFIRGLCVTSVYTDEIKRLMHSVYGEYVDFEIEKVEVAKYYGFTLDGNGRFLLGSHLVTHNTVVSSFLGSQTNGIVLVVYHRTILGEQWLTTFNKFTDAEVWMVDNKNNVPEQCNVILTMDTMIFNIPPEILKLVKCLIIDEAHAFCVPSRVSCLLASQPAYVIACSATLDSREDGMQDMIYALCGKNMVIKESTKPFEVYKVMTGITMELFKNKAGVINWSQLVKDLTESELRNKFIIDLILQNPEHKIIVLTWTKAHVDYIYNKLLENNIDAEYLCGNKKKYDDSNVLIGTISKIGTGFDEATSCHNFKGRKSNMMIICGSIKNQGGLEQFVGRVFRADYPTIFHLVDEDRISKSHWRNCQKWYLSRNGTINQIELDPNNPSEEMIHEQSNEKALEHVERIKKKYNATKN